MATEEQIKEVAYNLWEQEGRPEGKDLEHYLRAKKILEEGPPPVIEVPPSPAPVLLAPREKPRFGRRVRR